MGRKVISLVRISIFVFSSVVSILAMDIKRVENKIPESIGLRDSIETFNRVVFWAGVNRIIVGEYFGDRKNYLVDISSGQVLSEFSLGKYEHIRKIDRRTGLVHIWSLEQMKYLSIGHDPADTDPPLPCLLSYEYHGAPKRKSTFSFVRSTPEGQSQGTPRLVNEIFPPGGLADPGPMNVVDCLRGGEKVLLSAVYESQGSLYCAQLNDLYLIRISYLGIYGAQAFFVTDDTIITLKNNEDIETGEDEPHIYYPVLVSTEGTVVFENRSIRMIQAVRVFDYDPITKRIVAFIQGPTRTSSRIAVFQLAE